MYRLLIMLIALSFVGCYHSTQHVIQGKCMSYDEAKKTIYLDDELTPEVDNIAINISTAKIGVIPDAGDWLRISYKTEADKYIALKVMNLTRQKKLLADVGIEVTAEGVKMRGEK